MENNIVQILNEYVPQVFADLHQYKPGFNYSLQCCADEEFEASFIIDAPTAEDIALIKCHIKRIQVLLEADAKLFGI